MTVDVTHDCIWILNADKHLRFLQSKHLQCRVGGNLTQKISFPQITLKWMDLAVKAIYFTLYLSNIIPEGEGCNCNIDGLIVHYIS